MLIESGDRARLQGSNRLTPIEFGKELAAKELKKHERSHVHLCDLCLFNIQATFDRRI
jgi:hypothetical protein